MYAQIHAINAENDEWLTTFKGGKTNRIKPRDFKVFSSGDELAIRATWSEERGTGIRGGNTKTITRRLVMNLDANDLQKILEVAIKAKLVNIPGSHGVAEAVTLLELSLSEMGLIMERE